MVQKGMWGKINGRLHWGEPQIDGANIYWWARAKEEEEPYLSKSPWASQAGRKLNRVKQKGDRSRNREKEEEDQKTGKGKREVLS